MGWDCLSSEIVKARKKHQCCMCLLTIEPGQRYIRRCGVDHGEFAAIKIHLNCEQVTIDNKWDYDTWESFSPGSDFREELAEWRERNANAEKPGEGRPK